MEVGLQMRKRKDPLSSQKGGQVPVMEVQGNAKSTLVGRRGKVREVQRVHFL